MFDYFNAGSAQKYQFYRIPKILITGDQYSRVSVEAKLLYGLMLDRLSLSQKNGWIDEEGHVYIIYSVKDIQEDLHCGNKKVASLLEELDSINLIKRKRRGLGLPSLIFPLDFSTDIPDAPDDDSLNSDYPDSEPLIESEVPESGSTGGHFLKCQNDTSGDVETTLLEVSKRHANKTNMSKTELNNNIYPPSLPKSEPETDDKAGGQDLERKDYRNYFVKRFDVPDLRNEIPEYANLIDQIVDLCVDVVSGTARSYRVNHEEVSADIVKARFMKLEKTHLRYVLDFMSTYKEKVRSLRNFLITLLFNAPVMMDSFYRNYDKRDPCNDSSGQNKNGFINFEGRKTDEDTELKLIRKIIK